MSISDKIKAKIREEAGNRCSYCQSAQKYVFAPLEIDHIKPTALGGTDDEGNLCLACRMCNGFKSDKSEGHDPLTGETVALFNPRKQIWSEHFAWSGDGSQIKGLSSCGRATVIVLQLNNLIAVMVRREWIAAGWHPPKQG